MDKKCPNCGSDLPEEASFCLNCFSPLNITPINSSEKRKKQPKGIIVLVLAMVFISALVSVLIVNATAKKQVNGTTPSTTSNTFAIKVTTSEQSTAKKTTSTEKSTVTDSTTEKESATTSTTESTTAKATTKPTTTKKKSTTKAGTTTKKATTTEKATTPSVVINEGTLVSYPAGKTSSTYKIPYNVKKIKDNAFNNKYLKTLKFSKRESVECDWGDLFSGLPNLETVYVYPGTSADLEGLQYFDGEIVYYD